jgi:hypothetical protein
MDAWSLMYPSIRRLSEQLFADEVGKRAYVNALKAGDDALKLAFPKLQWIGVVGVSGFLVERDDDEGLHGSISLQAAEGAGEQVGDAAGSAARAAGRPLVVAADAAVAAATRTRDGVILEEGGLFGRFAHLINSNRVQDFGSGAALVTP